MPALFLIGGGGLASFRRHTAVVLLALLAAPVCVPAQSPEYRKNPKFQKEVAAAKAPQQSASDRLGHWKKANKISGGVCLECLDKMASLQFREHDFKGTIVSTSAFETLATTPAEKAYAQLLRGSAWFYMGGVKPKPEQLEQADAAFRAALASDPQVTIAAYMDGRASALLHRDDQARAMFTRYANEAPATDKYRPRALHFSVNPELARQKMAPPFTVNTLDGRQFTLDDMGGRVVLVDFWATWCGPCNQELPHVKKIAQEFAGQPFVLISISWDSDPDKWKAFIEKNGMTWNQYRDANHELSTAYGVNAIPHYFTIDADGVLQAEEIGSGSDIEGKLRKLVAQAKAAARPQEVAATLPGQRSGSGESR